MPQSWTLTSQGPWTKRRKHQVVVWNDQILILGGFDGETSYDLNDVWSWKQNQWHKVVEHAAWSGRDGHTAVVLNDAIFVLGGTDDPFQCKSDVWRSDDGGLTWEEKCSFSPWPERWQHAACRHGDRMFLSGGWGTKFFNDVWYSSDGVSWVLACQSAPWRPRMFHSMVSFNGKLYVFGGHDGKNQLRDVWASSDNGESWNLVLSAAPWQSRQGHATAVSKDCVYLMGGFGGSQRFNDFWQTSDFVNWVNLSDHCEWTARQGHAATFFQGSVYILGGFDEAGYSNSVYRYVVTPEVSATISSGTVSSAAHEEEASCEVVFSPLKPGPLDLSGLSRCLEKWNNLREMRQHRDNIIQDLVFVIGVVTRVFQFSDFEARKRTSSTADLVAFANETAAPLPDTSPLSASAVNMSANVIPRLAKPPSIPASSSTPDFSMIGSPFRENVLGSAGSNQNSRRSSRDIVGTDPLEFWQKLTELSATSTNVSPRDPTVTSQLSAASTSSQQYLGIAGGHPQSHTLRSASLHEAIEQNRRAIQLIQQQIRQAADLEEESHEKIADLIEQRAQLASAALMKVEAMEDHLSRMRSLYEERQQDLLKAIAQLEDAQQLHQHQLQAMQPSSSDDATSHKTTSNSTINNRSYRSYSLEDRSPDHQQSQQHSVWTDIVHRSADMMHQAEDVSTLERHLLRLRQCLSIISALSTKLAGAFAVSSHPDDEQGASAGLDSHLHSFFDQNASSSPGGDSANDTEKNDISTSTGVVEALGKALVEQMRVTQDVDGKLAEEGQALSLHNQTLLDLLGDALAEGLLMVQRVHAQSSATFVEITRMHDDVVDWKRQVQLWEDRPTLQQRCEAMVAEVSSLEDELLHWENTRIDLKSSAEKAQLSKSRSGSKALQHQHSGGSHGGSNSSSSSGSSGSGAGTSDLEQLRQKLAAAEKSSKAARKALRSWYRGHRNFVVHTVPELFHTLPDFKAPGSVLGDGGFAQSANIPRRQLSEYDDVVPFDRSEDSAAQSLPPDNKNGTRNHSNKTASTSSIAVSGRHLLLKAQYEGQEVVLKGFVMHNSEQRRGMDREIDILSRLKSDMIISPQAIVDASADASDPTLQITLFIEYPFYRRGNLAAWLQHSTDEDARKPWELQSVARQVLFGIMYLHDHGVVHRDIKPSNILMRDDDRIVLTDFELSQVIFHSGHSNGFNANNNNTNNGNGGAAHASFGASAAAGSDVDFGAANEREDGEGVTITRSGTTGFMAPEVESGRGAGFASDMFSFGALLYCMHFPRDFHRLLPHAIKFPSHADADLCDLIQSLLALDPSARPTAATALTHAYFRATFVDRLMQEGEIVEQDRKLEAVRNLLNRTRASNRHALDKIEVSRDSIVEDTLKYFSGVSLEHLRRHLKVTFRNEPGVDEGGLLTEMFSLFFDEVFSPRLGLFEDCNGPQHSSSAPSSSSPRSRATSMHDNSEDTSSRSPQPTAENYVVLPAGNLGDDQSLLRLRAVGRAMVKALYEGRRVGNRLGPSVLKFFTGAQPTMRDLQLYDAQAAKSLQWLLTTVGVEELGLHFEEVDDPDRGPVTDANKAQYVRMKVQKILVDSRLASLTALKTGFLEALQGLSTEAAPFLTLLSHSDWRIMLCGETVVSAPHIVSALRFSGFPKRSKVPVWLTDLLLSASEDHLRKFLVFVTGSPSLTASFGQSSSQVKINVRHQTRSAALPTAHTCFYHLDIPDYDDRDVFQNKLFYAIQNANTFEIV